MADAGRRPVLLVTSYAPPDRIAPFAALHERVGIEVALFGGRTHHATAGWEEDLAALPFPARHLSERAVHALAASGRHRAVIAGIGGRVALPAAWRGARRARVPFVLWASLWAHPVSAAHALSYLPLRAIYRDADAVATYGPHVSAYVRARGARNVVEAPQSVDVGFWSGAPTRDERRASLQFLFASRWAREKGARVLLRAWAISGYGAPQAALVLVGGGQSRSPTPAASAVVRAGMRSPAEVRNFLAAADVVVVPSIPTRTFREPWGLTVNEAMCQATPVIASDAVGAAAGGLVRDGETGVVVPAGDPHALAAAMRRLGEDPAARTRLGAAGRAAAARLTPAAWADGMAGALARAEEPRC